MTAFVRLKQLETHVTENLGLTGRKPNWRLTSHKMTHTITHHDDIKAYRWEKMIMNKAMPSMNPAMAWGNL